MASLIENLILELNQEYAIYEKLLETSMEKTSVIVSNDLDRLKDITDREQLLVDNITSLESERRQTLKDIANVLGKSNQELKISEIVIFLEGQDQFHDPLLLLNEKLAKIAKKLREVNAHNQNLIQESLSMIEYSINLFQNLNRAPETAEYTKDMFKGSKKYSDIPAAPESGKFDTKY